MQFVCYDITIVNGYYMLIFTIDELFLQLSMDIICLFFHIIWDINSCY